MKGYKPPPKWFDRAQRICRGPKWWVLLGDYDPEWDHYVRMAITMNMIDLHYYGQNYGMAKELENLDEPVVQIGETEVWVGNYPYAFGNPMTESDELKMARPSVSTTILLAKAVERLLAEKHGIKRRIR